MCSRIANDRVVPVFPPVYANAAFDFDAVSMDSVHFKGGCRYYFGLCCKRIIKFLTCSECRN